MNINKIIQETIQSHINNIIIENKINNITFISYGTDAFDINKFRQPIFDGPRVAMNNKPIGGLWASPLEAKNSWADFCDNNAFHLKSLAKHFIFKLKPNAKIYIIDNEKDLRNITRLAPTNIMPSIDWSLLKNDYDGIYITDNGANIRCLDDILALDAWDVASLCVFNPNVIDPIQENAFDKAKISKKEANNPRDWDENNPDRKYLQMQSDFDKYSNQNINPNMGDLFNGEHPAILAQKHGNSKNAKLAKKFKGMIKQGL